MRALTLRRGMARVQAGAPSPGDVAALLRPPFFHVHVARRLACSLTNPLPHRSFSLTFKRRSAHIKRPTLAQSIFIGEAIFLSGRRVYLSASAKRRKSSGVEGVVACDIIVSEVADRVMQGAPLHFRQAVLDGFSPVVPGCFLSHGGDRPTLVAALKSCRLPPAAGRELAEQGADELDGARRRTHAFVRELWNEAAKRGLIVGSDGIQWRSAASTVTQAFLSEVPENAALEVKSASAAGVGSAVVTTEAAAEAPTWRSVGLWLTPEAEVCGDGRRFSQDDFADFVPAYWRAQLARVDRSEALRLIGQLGGDDSIGYLRSKANDNVSSVLEKVFAWREAMPSCVLLVQLGDFFEVWGSDAVMLVQWCGLNPMARKPRAGFPATATQLQQALDGLTRAELSVAVVVQTGQPGIGKQHRVLRQVVTPGAPTYLYGHELKGGMSEASTEFSEGRPYIAMRLRTDGLLYAELRPFRREIRFRENVTPEGVEALLASNDGIAGPVFVDGARGSFKQTDRWPWFPKNRKWLGLPTQAQDSQFLDACCQALCDTLQVPVHPEFQRVRLDSGGALQPLSLSTARNLGVLPRDGIPPLVEHMLGKDAPASSKRVLRRWLLAPRSAKVVGEMRKLLRALLDNDALVLPPLQRVPSVAKVVAYVTADAATERLFRDLRSCCEDVRAVLHNERAGTLVEPLLAVVASDLGEVAIDGARLAEDLDAVIELIDATIHDEAIQDEAAVGLPAVGDAATQRVVERFFEANEVFRGVASQAQEAIAGVYSEVAACKAELCQALGEGLEGVPAQSKDVLKYNSFDNDVCFIKKPAQLRAVGATDRRGKTKKDRFTTPRLRDATAAYLAATRAAGAAVLDALRELCRALQPSLAVLRCAVATAELLLAAHRHAAHANGRGWGLPTLSASADLLFAVRVTPYWLHVDAVPSHVRLDARGALATGPNMSGKSTLMRALGAAALLANCGFMSPCQGIVPTYRQVFFLAAEGDRPDEGVSAFGQEAQLSAALLRRTCGRSLALVDEFGRGTEPVAACASVGALVEELAQRGTQFVVATHLHGVADMLLQLPEGRERPALWRMGVAAREAAERPRWTYALEEGICRESYAWLTLGQFGWSKTALSRFHRLMRILGDGKVAEATAEVDREKAPNPDAVLEAFGDVDVDMAPTDALPEASSLAFLGSTASDAAPWDAAALSNVASGVAQAICEVAGCLPEAVLRLRPRDSPPAALSAGAAVLYVLQLRDGRLYVGQTDYLQGRLKAHLSRFGAELALVLVARVTRGAGGAGGTADARLAESALQRRLLREGAKMVSVNDAAHSHFSTTRGPAGYPATNDHAMAMTGDLAAESRRLRETAEYLQRLADQLDSLPQTGGAIHPR